MDKYKIDDCSYDTKTNKILQNISLQLAELLKQNSTVPLTDIQTELKCSKCGAVKTKGGKPFTKQLLSVHRINCKGG